LLNRKGITKQQEEINLISTLSDVVPQGDIAAQHDEKLGTTNFRMLSREAGYHGTTTLKFIGVWGPGWGFGWVKMSF
jgi:hypothetical protein